MHGFVMIICVVDHRKLTRYRNRVFDEFDSRLSWDRGNSKSRAAIYKYQPKDITVISLTYYVDDNHRPQARIWHSIYTTTGIRQDRSSDIWHYQRVTFKNIWKPWYRVMP